MNFLISLAGALYMAIIIAKVFFNIYADFNLSFTRDKFFYIPIGLFYVSKFLIPQFTQILYCAIGILVILYAVSTIFDVISAMKKKGKD